MQYNKRGRELDLILLLSENASCTAQQIAERLGVTRRTVYNYLESLAGMGLHVLKSGSRYRLDHTSAFFRRLHEALSLSEDEAAYLCRLLAAADNRDYKARAIRQKIARLFHLADSDDPELLRRVSASLAVLKKAMSARQMVMLHNYSSPHSHTVSDRIVEPFLFIDDGRNVRCHEVSTHMNKTFKVARMESAEMLDVPWAFADGHKRVFTDIFAFSGERRSRVSVLLGQLSRNLLLEEYPAAADFLSQSDGTHWLLEIDVASFRGIGRFVMGLLDDIDVLGNDAFKSYISGKVRSYSRRVMEY